MSNQLQITGGAKVRNLQGVITGTSGVLGSLGINVPDGIPQLDGSGKILVSQLPNSVMEYKGTWNAATNTPTLVDGTGNAGDVYLCNVAGTVNFGSGPITFYVGDQALYSGSIWQRASGASGTVTSVSLTESGDSLTITGSPITTSGTINIGFAGNSTQYINGAGNLTTFPSIITEAQNLVTEVYNETGATLSKGSVVYINGGHGNLPTVTKAQADNEVDSAQTYGLVRTDITNNNNGYVTVAGRLENIDTSSFTGGATLYLSPTVAGGYTTTKPTSPDHIVYVGVVVRSHPTQGVIEVNIQNTQELKESSDVLITSPTNNQGLFYDSAASLWKNNSIATALGYTPANDAMVVHLAGTETITGAKTFSSAIKSDSSILLKNGVQSILSGYVDIAGNTFGKGIDISYYDLAGTSPLTQNLFFSPTASYTYTFPSITGTLALLEGTQTFTGAKTFASSVNNDDGLKIKLGSASNLTAGYLTLSSYGESSPLPDRTVLRIGTAATQLTLFKLQNTNSFTYDFPAANGTIALTSDLSFYVPYTGATSNVNLGSNNLTASQLNLTSATNTYLSIKSTYPTTGKDWLITSVGSNGSLEFAVNGTSANLILKSNGDVTFPFGRIDNGTYTYTLPSATGTLALTSNLSSYVPYTGATANLNLGTNALLASTLSVLGAGTTAGYLSFTPNTNNAYSAWTSVAAYGDSALAFSFSPSAGQKIFNLDVSGLTVSTMRTYTMPNASGTLVLGTGTTNYLPKFTGTSTIGNSAISDDGTTVTLVSRALSGTSATFSGDVSIVESGNALLRVHANTISSPIADIELMRGTNATWGADGYGDYRFRNSGGDLLIQYGDTGVTSTRVTISSSGNLGLGVTPSAWYSLSRAIDIGAGGAIQGRSNTSGTFELTTNAYLNSSGNWAYKASSVAANLYALSDGSYKWYIAPSGTAGAAITFTQAMTLASTGNLLVGTTTDAGYKLDVNGTGRFSGRLNANVALSDTSGTFALAMLGDYAGLRTGTDGSFNVDVYKSGTGYINPFKIASTGAATFSSNVGIGTSSPTAYTGYSTLALNGSNGGIIEFKKGDVQQSYIGNAGDPVLQFVTSGSEKMRITSGGNVCIGATSYTSLPTSQVFAVFGSGGQGTLKLGGYGAPHTQVTFIMDGVTTAGTISCPTASTTNYNTSSDYRLKQDFKDFNGLDLISSINTYNYEWKSDKIRSYGVIAHELQQVLPYAVTGEKDGEEMQGVDYSKIVPVLVKAIQELKTEIDELKNK